MSVNAVNISRGETQKGSKCY